MPDTSEQRIARLQQRLQQSREEFFELAQAMRGQAPPPDEAHAHPGDSGFPHSRLMRALMGKPFGIALGTAAVAATMLRPRLLVRALRFAPVLRPLLVRYVLPRLLGQR